MTMGIYRWIVCGSKVYFGSSVNIEKRRLHHISDLTIQKHNNSRMQRCWNKYGPENFTFDIIKVVENEDDLLNEEQDYIDWAFRYLDETDRLNIQRVVGSRLGLGHSEETKQKISKAHKGKTLPRKVVDKQLLSRTKGKLYTFVSPDGLEYKNIFNIAEFCRDHNITMMNIRRVIKGQSSHSCGWIAYNQEIGIIPFKRKNNNKYIIISPKGEVFKDICNISKFCREHELSVSNMTCVLRGETNHCYGWSGFIQTESHIDYENLKPFYVDTLGRLYTLISSDGIIYDNVSSLSDFSKEHNLNYQSLIRVSNGCRPHYKGWKVTIKIRNSFLN